MKKAITYVLKFRFNNKSERNGIKNNNKSTNIAYVHCYKYSVFNILFVYLLIFNMDTFSTQFPLFCTLHIRVVYHILKIRAWLLMIKIAKRKNVCVL